MIRTVETPRTFREAPSARSAVATDVTFRAWGVGWRHMNVAAAIQPLLERKEELARIESALADARTGGLLGTNGG